MKLVTIRNRNPAEDHDSMLATRYGSMPRNKLRAKPVVIGLGSHRASITRSVLSRFSFLFFCVGAAAMFVSIRGVDYMVLPSHDSHFSRRRDKKDISVWVRSQWGGRYGERNSKYWGRYSCLRIVDADTGEVVRDYGAVPPELSDDILRQIGFI
jgi:hypothetical protein